MKQNTCPPASKLKITHVSYLIALQAFKKNSSAAHIEMNIKTFFLPINKIVSEYDPKNGKRNEWWGR